MKRGAPRKSPIDKKAERRQELRRRIKMAAFVLEPNYGSLVPLAAKAGVTEHAIHKAISRGEFSSLMAIALEAAVGREHLTKEFLCPKKFGAEK